MRWLHQLVGRYLRWSAENATMKQYGVSRLFVQAVIGSIEECARGEISLEDWITQSVVIAELFPIDYAKLQYARQRSREKVSQP